MSKTAGQVLQEILAKKEQRVAASHNAAGYGAMLPEAVREVLKQFPNLQASGRRALAGSIHEKAKQLERWNDTLRFGAALGEVNRILGITRDS